jgi:hypothetical protein
MFTVSGAFWQFLVEHYGCDETIEMHRFLKISQAVPAIQKGPVYSVFEIPEDYSLDEFGIKQMKLQERVEKEQKEAERVQNEHDQDSRYYVLNGEWIDSWLKFI